MTAPSLLLQVLQGLTAAVPDAPDALTLSEMLWLAPLLPSAEPDQTTVPEPDSDPETVVLHDSLFNDLDSAERSQQGKSAEGLSAHAVDESAVATNSTTVDIPRDPPPTVSAPAPAAALLPQEALPQESDARALLPVWLEDPPLLADSLAFLRALAPLQAEQVEGPRLRLDEEATVAAYVASCGPEGRGGCWQPVLVPIPEPRYELVLVIDGAPMMTLWQRLALDLQRALASCAVVRQLHVVTLAPDGSVPLPKRRWCQPQPEGRRLFLLLSDCCGDAWWSGEIAQRLAEWGKPETIAILQVLPSWMWPQSALGLGDELVLTNAGPSAHGRWKAERQRWLSEEPDWLADASGERERISTVAAVLRCDPEGVAVWTDLLTARPDRSCAGVLLPRPEALVSQREADQVRVVGPEDAEQGLTSAEAAEAELDRLYAFQAMATPRARKLLQLLAAAPVLTLPVIRLVRQALLFGDRTPLATAEVLLGGVLQLKENPAQSGGEQELPETWQFTMAPEVREELMRGVADLDAAIVFNAVSRLVEERWNQFMPRGSFRAFLTDPYQHAPPELAGIEGFASVAAHILDQLGGDYSALASQLREGARKAVSEPWPADDFIFEEMEFETGAQHPSGFPPLETLQVETAQVQLQTLEPLALITATVQASARFGMRTLGESWSKPTIKTIDQSTWCFRQPIGALDEYNDGSAVSLTLVEIPAGSFLMGSPPDEPERLPKQGPQHSVELAGFFITQAPITQAQWRAVMDSNPSYFSNQPDSDQRPVEKVSWRDAMAFCHRLRELTGRYYTLPSEAQWEYACRAGTTTPFHFGETITPDLANYDAKYTYANGPEGEYRKQTTPVGVFPANAWGLQDMHGNVMEWCLDQWHENYAGAPSDGSAWVDSEDKKSVTLRLLRGGSWGDTPRYCRSAYRDRHEPDDAGSDIGFRVVCLPQDPSLNT